MNTVPSTQDTIVAVKDTVTSTIEKAKDLIYAHSDTLQTEGVPQPPHGQAPCESCTKGIVAYEDKTLTGKLTENLDNIQSRVSSLRRPSLDALIALQTEGVPQPPHGIPPSELDHKGTVAFQDKSIITLVSENLPELPSVPLPLWSDYTQEISAFYEVFPLSLAETVNLVERKLGRPYNVVPGTIPAPPSGTPPSDNLPHGRISETDKPVQRQLEENWEMLRSEFLTLWSQSKRKLGWNWIQPGTTPEPPRGVPPSQGNVTGVVDDHDKLFSTQIDEAAAQLKDEVARGYQGTVQAMADTSTQVTARAESLINQAGRAVGMSYQVKEGCVPQPPHGVPPSDSTGLGIVSEDDKSIPQKVGDAWEQVKEATKEKIVDTKQGLDRFAVETSTALTGGYL